MTTWTYTLDLTPVWPSDDIEEKGEETLRPIVESIIKWLKSEEAPEDSPEVPRLISDLEEFIDDGIFDVEDFDVLMGDLYDWGDRNRVWIKTFG